MQSKLIHSQYSTEFDSQVSNYLKQGWRIVPGSYQFQVVQVLYNPQDPAGGWEDRHSFLCVLEKEED